MSAAKTDLITIEDLEELGVELTDEGNIAKAQKWITYVSNYLRLIARNNGVNLDEKLKEDRVGGDGTFSSVVQMVVSNAVMRANAKPVEIPDAVSYSQSATPYAESVNYGANATQDAYFKQKELALLGFSSISGRRSIGLIRGIRG